MTKGVLQAFDIRKRGVALMRSTPAAQSSGGLLMYSWHLDMGLNSKWWVRVRSELARNERENKETNNLDARRDIWRN